MPRPSFPLHAVYLPPILRLHPEVGGMFVDHMDLLSLTRWRLTCKMNYDQTTSGLRRTLLALIQRFVPFPTTLLDLVTKSRAIIGGEVALAFLLRDRTYTTGTMEVYASEFEFKGLCDAVLADEHIQSRVDHQVHTTNPHTFALRRLVAETLAITMTNGRVLHIHRSYTISPAAPLTRNPCTALSNFVTAYSFGCSHPLLTLQRRALLADSELRHLPPLDASILNNMLTHKFTMAVSPAAWPEFRLVEDRDATEDPAVEPLYPLRHVSSFTGFTAVDADPDTHWSPSSVDDLAFDVGLAQAVYAGVAFGVVDGLDGDVGGLDEDVDSDVQSTDYSSPGTPLMAADAPDVAPTGEDAPPAAPSLLPEDIDSTLGGAPSVCLQGSPSLPPSGHGLPPIDPPGGTPCVDADERGGDATGPSRSTYPCVLQEDGSADDEPSSTVKKGGVPVAATTIVVDPESHSPRLRLEAQRSLPAVGASTATDVETIDPSLSPCDGMSAGDVLDHDLSNVVDDTRDTVELQPGIAVHPDEEYVEGSETDTSVDYPPRPRNDDVSVRCWRHLYICPSQGRYFGDRGSFVDFLDPLGGGEDKCVELNIAPYGSMVVWRIMSSFDCEEGCEYFDNILEEGVTSIPVMFKRDPYGELRDIVSDRYMPAPRGPRSPRRRRSHSV